MAAYPEASGLHPGDRAVVVLDVEVLRRVETPTGPRYRVYLGDVVELEPGDVLDSERGRRRLFRAAGQLERRAR